MWRIRAAQASASDVISRVHPVTAQCLANRGIASIDDVERFFDPALGRLRPPVGLAGYDDAVSLLTSAVVAKRRIGVFGDYDADGVTSAAVLTLLLRAVAADHVTRVAHRDRGYGFTNSDADYFAQARCDIVLIADCGTSDVEAVAAMRASGAEVIIIDHHTVPPAALTHPASVLVNPLLSDSSYPNRSMASVGLSFYVACGLRTALRARGSWPESFDVRSLLDLVAVGTIGDMVPMVNENRIFVTAGLRWLAQRARPGLAALLQKTGVAEDARVTENLVGWRIGPYLNAPGRLGDADAALQLLLAERSQAEHCADAVIAINEKRKEASSLILDEVMDNEFGDVPIVIANEAWHAGVVGIAASRLKDKFGQPAFVIASAGGEWRGSARAPRGVHLVEWLTACDDLLLRYGGHAQAAGFSIAEENVAAFSERVQSMVAGPASPKQQEVDSEISIADINEQLATELSQFMPYGKGNDRPLLGCRDLSVERVRLVGEGKHVKMTVADPSGRSINAIAFGMGDSAPTPGQRIDAVVTPRLNTWGGMRRVELQIHKMFSDASDDDAA